MCIKLTVSESRSIVLHAQLLNNTTHIPSNKNGVYEIINHLGYLQLDTLSVVKRAHHHTLWNRHPDYEPDMLLELQRDDKLVFEYWGHATSYLPMKDYRFYQHRMTRADDPNSKWEKERLEKYGYFVLPILWKDRFVGLLDPKSDRKKKQLILKNIFFEEGFDEFEKFLPSFAKTLVEFMKFNECESIVIDSIRPEKLKEKLEKKLEG